MPVVTARDGAGMAVFSRCGHDRSAEWLLSFRRYDSCRTERNGIGQRRGTGDCIPPSSTIRNIPGVKAGGLCRRYQKKTCNAIFLRYFIDKAKLSPTTPIARTTGRREAFPMKTRTAGHRSRSQYYPTANSRGEAACGCVNDAIGRRTSMSRSGSAYATPDTISYTYNDRSELTGAVSNVDTT